MIEYYFKTAREEDFIQIDQIREGCWIHLDEATSNDLGQLCQLIGLDYIDLQDSLDKYEVPRIEKTDHQVLIFARHPSEFESGLYTGTLTIVLTPHYFITISPQKSTLVHNFLSRKTKLSTQQRSKLLIHLLLKIAQEFTFGIRKVRHNVMTQEKEMINVDSDDITALTKHEEILNQYFSTLTPLRTTIEIITSGKYVTLLEKDSDLLLDLVNAVKQSEDLCNIVIKSIRGLRDSYQIIFTNNLHKTIKLLTSLTIIFSIPTMVASLYGMNVDLPLAHRSNAFIVIVSFIFAMSLVGLLVFRRKKWL